MEPTCENDWVLTFREVISICCIFFKTFSIVNNKTLQMCDGEEHAPCHANDKYEVFKN